MWDEPLWTRLVCRRDTDERVGEQGAFSRARGWGARRHPWSVRVLVRGQGAPMTTVPAAFAMELWRAVNDAAKHAFADVAHPSHVFRHRQVGVEEERSQLPEPFNGRSADLPVGEWHRLPGVVEDVRGA
jgi:hypothetical protein